jgi:hypothetical protein
MYTYNNNDNNNNCISTVPNTSTRKSLSAHRNKRKVMYDDELNGCFEKSLETWDSGSLFNGSREIVP